MLLLLFRIQKIINCDFFIFVADKLVPQILISNKQFIREIDLQGHANVKIHNLTNVVGLDFDYESGCLYWSEVTKELKVIRRQCPSNRTHQVSMK